MENTAKKCSSVLTIPNKAVVHGRVHISFMHVDLENEILFDKQKCQPLFFRIREISVGEKLL